MQKKASIAGILSIISGIFGIFWLGYAFLLNYLFKAMLQVSSVNNPPYFLGYQQVMGVFYIAWGIIAATIGIFAIVSGILTLRRTNWGLALAGTIASTLIFFPCGIPAIILISNAQNEFSTNH